MTNFESIYQVGSKDAASLPGHVYVFASADALEGLQALGEIVTLVEVAPGALLPSDDVAAAEIAVVEVDPSDRHSVRRLDALRTRRPDLEIVVGLADIDLSTTRVMLQKGVSDVVAIPFDNEELLTAVIEIDRQRDRKRDDEIDLAPVVSVLKCRGGSGSTTIATHIAPALAERMEGNHKACVIDLDLQSGDVASYFDRQPRMNLTDLLDASNKIDDELFRSVAVECGPSVDVIGAPHDIMPIEDISLEGILRILGYARRKYDVVVLDLPGVLTNWAMSVLLASDMVLLVGDGNVAGLRQVKRKLALLESLDMDKRKVAIALNRVSSGLFKKVNSSAVDQALGHAITQRVHSDPEIVDQAQVSGVLVYDIQKRSRFGRDIAALADTLVDTLEEEI